VNDGAERLGDVCSVKGSSPSEHFVQDASECPDIRTLVDRSATGLLRRHVAGTADDCAGHRTTGYRRRIRNIDGSAFIGERLCQSEIEHFHLAVGRELDVRRLQVAVNDAAFVRRFERLRDLLRNLQSFIDRNRAALDSFAEGFTLDQLHDDATRISELLQPVDVRNILVIQRSQELCFTLKSRQPIRIGRKMIRQYLEGYITL
jgi:hypothetical protein